jgi:hypothetical protein
MLPVWVNTENVRASKSAELIRNRASHLSKADDGDG